MKVPSTRFTAGLLFGTKHLRSKTGISEKKRGDRKVKLKAARRRSFRSVLVPLRFQIAFVVRRVYTYGCIYLHVIHSSLLRIRPVESGPHRRTSFCPSEPQPEPKSCCVLRQISSSYVIRDSRLNYFQLFIPADFVLRGSQH